jgi:predicted nucleic acid-binding protein
MKKLRVFIDSNVWFSAFYKKGIASDLIDKLLQKKLEKIAF